jgi:hypothetical protein
VYGSVMSTPANVAEVGAVGGAGFWVSHAGYGEGDVVGGELAVAALPLDTVAQVEGEAAGVWRHLPFSASSPCSWSNMRLEVPSFGETSVLNIWRMGNSSPLPMPVAGSSEPRSRAETPTRMTDSAAAAVANGIRMHRVAQMRRRIFTDFPLAGTLVVRACRLYDGRQGRLGSSTRAVVRGRLDGDCRVAALLAMTGVGVVGDCRAALLAMTGSGGFRIGDTVSLRCCGKSLRVRRRTGGWGRRGWGRRSPNAGSRLRT